MVYFILGGYILAAITDVDRVKRLHEIEKCNQEDMTNHEISKKLYLPINTVERCQKYLEDLGRADITPEVLSKKRSELYLEFSEATQEAKKLFDTYKSPLECKYCKGTGIITKIKKKKEIEYVCDKCSGYGMLHKTKDAERFFRTWLEAIEKKAKLYGLDNVKSENVFQQVNIDNMQYVSDMKIPHKLKEQTRKLADKIKEDHEEALKRTHDEENI